MILACQDINLMFALMFENVEQTVKLPVIWDAMDAHVMSQKYHEFGIGMIHGSQWCRLVAIFNNIVCVHVNCQ